MKKALTPYEKQKRRARREAKAFAVEQWEDVFEEFEKLEPLIRQLVEHERLGESLEAMQARRKIDQIQEAITEAQNELGNAFNFGEY